MYQALYRKYRPSTFDDVVGQDIIIKTLKNAIQNNKLTHAYLFTGPRGTGKTSTAKILAKTINCQNLNNFEPCNKCESCIQINNKQTTDIIEIDAASNNGVDEIRELKSKVNLVPSNSKYKVYIIDEVHMLSTGAFNALLKTLEEPPSHIIFILATTEPHKIPATILSRCQRFDFKKISTQKIVENLKKITEQESIFIDTDALQEIAVLSQGGMRDSISLLDQAISYCNNHITCDDIHDINGTVGNNEMKTIVETIVKRDITSLLKLFDGLDERGKNLIKLVEELIYYLRNVLICKIAPDYFEQSEQTAYTSIGNEVEQDLLLKFIKIFSEAIYEMKNSDNEKITLELYLIELMYQKKETEYENAVKEISVLQSNLADFPKKLEKKEQQQTSVLHTQNDEEKKQNLIVKEETRKSDIDFELEERLKKLKQARINNTLSCFSRKTFLEMKEKLEYIKKHLFDETYSQWVALVLDGDLKAAGKDHLIFIYKDVPMEELFNHNLSIIEKIFQDTYGQSFRLIATNVEEWNIIKQEFNSKSKIYEWQDEPDLNQPKINIENHNAKNEIEDLFEDIIEYTE